MHHVTLPAQHEISSEAVTGFASCRVEVLPQRSLESLTGCKGNRADGKLGFLHCEWECQLCARQLPPGPEHAAAPLGRLCH